MTFEELKQVRLACLNHAEVLLAEATRLLESHPYLAYHLATLALEEIGKTIQVAIEAMPVAHPSGNKPVRSDRDDHVQKLFWALWNPLSRKESLQPDHLNWCGEFSREIHRLRLRGLYVDFIDGHLSTPKDAINKERARKFVDLAKARLNLALLEEPAELDEEKKLLLQWFSRVAWDDEKAKWVFAKKSLEKLAEFKNSEDWFRWLKDEFDKAAQESQRLLQQELARTEPSGAERAKPKWKVKIRLHTLSHSIRQADLNWINRMGDFWKLDRGKDHRELFVTFTLPASIPLQGLWHVGWAESRRFVVALNMGSLGFFWWQIPIDISRYYVHMSDLEAQSDIGVERVPRLTLNWGNRVLNQTDLFHMLMLYRFLPRGVDMKEPELLTKYLNALALMGKNDIHLRLEPSALLAFFEAFRIALQHFGDWDGKATFSDAAKAMFVRDWPELSDWSEILSLGETLLAGGTPTQEITLTHLAGMKMYCDIYMLKNVKAMADREKEKPKEKE